MSIKKSKEYAERSQKYTKLSQEENDKLYPLK